MGLLYSLTAAFVGGYVMNRIDALKLGSLVAHHHVLVVVLARILSFV